MRILKPQFWLVKNILKWIDCQVDPLGHCFRSSLRGIKVLILRFRFTLPYAVYTTVLLCKNTVTISWSKDFIYKAVSCLQGLALFTAVFKEKGVVKVRWNWWIKGTIIKWSSHILPPVFRRFPGHSF